MYCHDCENYFGEASCRVKGLTGYLRKADDLPCFKPKPDPKNDYPREDMANDLVALLRIYGNHGTLTKTYEDCEITITIR